MKALSFSTLIVFLLSTVLLSACNRNEEDTSDKIKVAGPANEILQKEGSLHIFKLQTFVQMPDSRDDIMLLTIDSFSPSTTNIEPEEDDDPTLNRLKYKQLSWNEDYLSWAVFNDPLLDSKYQKIRSYRVLDNGLLQAEVNTRLNSPIYETIDDNIFERQLATRFVWDFSRYGAIRSERDVSGDRIDDYKNLYNYLLLPYVDKWADIHLETIRFSEGATLYAASRSVAQDVVVVESVYNNNGFDLAPTRIAQGASSLNAALNTFPMGGNRLAYQFTVDYDQHHTLYMTFDTNLNKARLFTTVSGAPIADVDLIIDSSKPYIEIDTQMLSVSERQSLHLPSYFNPVIIGPFAGDFFYGKHYIKTDAANRLQLEPLFFLNTAAKNDVENTFKRWRQQVDNDRL